MTGMDLSDLPERMRSLPLDSVGRPVPAFVEWIDGTPDFRIMNGEHFRRCVMNDLCWTCGTRRGRHATFVTGPMCVVNLISAEPPSHHECAVWSATHCPFLVNPNKDRRLGHLPAVTEPAGIMIARNPGVSALVTSRNFKAFRVDAGEAVGRGVLVDMGTPERVEWFREGRPATYAEVHVAIATGIPLLREACDQEPTPRRQAEARFMLDLQYDRALALLPPCHHHDTCAGNHDTDTSDFYCDHDTYCEGEHR